MSNAIKMLLAACVVASAASCGPSIPAPSGQPSPAPSAPAAPPSPPATAPAHPRPSLVGDLARMPFELKVLSLRSSKPDELLTALGDVELCVVQNKISGTYSYAAAYVLKFETAVVLLHEKEFMTDYVDPEPPLYFEPGSVPRNLAGSDSIWLSDLLDETRPIRRMSPAARAAQSDEVRVKAREAVLEACRKRAVGK